MFKIVDVGCLIFIQCLPKASVQFLLPFNTISITVSKALADNRSVGLIKFPAALFNNPSIFPNFTSVASKTASTSV